MQNNDTKYLSKHLTIAGNSLVYPEGMLSSELSEEILGKDDQLPRV